MPCNDTNSLWPTLPAPAPGPRPAEAPPATPPRLQRAQRQQLVLRPVALDQLLPEDHPARMIWEAVGSLDLVGFWAGLRARGSEPGRAAVDPQILLSLWLYAATENVGSGRAIERLCQEHAAYQWLCGGVSVGYHTLNDFRVEHGAALDALMTQVLGRLMHAGLVSVRRVAQDSTLVRASAGGGSFRREPTLQQKLAEAEAHVAALKCQADDASASVAAKAARQAAAEDRVRRVRQALAEVAKVQESKHANAARAGRTPTPARASTTDPEARRMHMPDGGTRPAYRVELAVEPQSRAIVGVAVNNAGNDYGQAEPMRQQVQARTGQSVSEHLVDGGFCTTDEVERAAEDRVTLYMPVPRPSKEGVDPHAPRAGDSPAVAAWRARMGSEAGQAIYRHRAGTCEPVNGELKCCRGLGRLLVRGLAKVMCVALISVLAYNLLRFGAQLATVGR